MSKSPKLSRSAQKQVSLIRPTIAFALFATETSPQHTKVHLLENHHDDFLSPDLTEDSKDGFIFNNFGSLVKSTPFQTFTTKAACQINNNESVSTRNTLSPSATLSLEQSYSFNQWQQKSNEIKDFKKESMRIERTVKAGSKSPFAQ